MDHYRTLGVPRNCDRKALHRAFRELSKQNHPDRFDEAARPMAEKRYQKIVIAFNVLKDPKQRAKYDQNLNSQPATAPVEDQDPASLSRKYHKNGVTRFNQGQYAAAVDCFKRALHYQESAEAWYYRGMAEAELMQHGKEAVASLQKAVEKSPKTPRYHVQLIRTLLRFGLGTRAKGMIARSLEQFPENDELLEIAREIDPKKYKKGGFLGGLFGR